MPEPETVVTPKPEDAKPKAPPIKLGQSLSSQTRQLTELLKQEPADKPKEDPKPDDPKPAEGEPEAPVVPPVTDNNLDDYENPEAPASKPLEPIAKYILNKLPTLTTRIKVGDEVKVVAFKDVSELPADLVLADDVARAQFTVDVSAQVQRARDAMQEYKQAELQQNIQAFEAQEAKDVTADLAYLQRAGILEKFKYEEDDTNFNSDPAVKTANEIYDLYIKTNQAYAKKFAGTNRTFRISYRDAADKYFAAQSRQQANDSQKATEQPTGTKPKPKTPAQKERTEIAKQTGAPAGGEPKDNKPRVRAGMQMNDINRLVRMGKI